MQISGEWFLGSDGMVRPIMRGQVLAGNDSWVSVPFLVDTGADRTVFSAAVLAALQLQPITVYDRLGGLGGSPSKVTFRFAWQGFSQWRHDHRFCMPFVSLVSFWDLVDVSCSGAG
jgi:hypothetical protein